MSGNTDNVVLGLAVAVLGYVVYSHLTSASQAQMIGVGGANRPVNGSAAPNASAAWANTAGALLSPFVANLNAGGTRQGMTNGNYTFDQVYDSTSWNPDAISQAMQQDTYSALGAQGMDTSNQYGFYE
jgi:hypothetical protein